MSATNLSAILSYTSDEVTTEIIIDDIDVHNLVLHEGTDPEILGLDSGSSSTAMGRRGTYAMSPDSGYGDDVSRTSVSSSPTLVMVEQPERSYRFRYKRESNKPHGPIKSRKFLEKTPKKKSNGPRVKLDKFEGEGLIRVWLYQGNLENGPSPHRLVTTKDGDIIDEPHDLLVNRENDYTASFDKLNILHVVKNEPEYQALYLKKKRGLATTPNSFCMMKLPKIEDTFNQRDVLSEWKSKEMDICALLFEAYEKRGNDYYFVESLLSEPIKNTKSPKTNALKIARQSHVEGSCLGSTDVMIFTEKMVKEVKIIFFDQDGWEDDASFEEKDIHKQVGIAFKTPPYKHGDITEPVDVQFHILRTTDGATSAPRDFRYLPKEDNFLFSEYHQPLKRKKPASLATEINLLQQQIDRNKIVGKDVPLAYHLLNEENSLMNDLCFGLDSENFIADLEDEVSTDELLKDSLPLSAYQNLTTDRHYSKTKPKQYSVVDQGQTEECSVLSQEKAKSFSTDSIAEKVRRIQLAISRNDTETFTKLTTPQIVNFKYNGRTLLHVAVLCDRPSMVSKLLSMGANIYALDNINSDMALHHAVKSPSCLGLLLQVLKKRKAMFNKDGDDPVLVATRNTNLRALDLLLTKQEFSPFTRNVVTGDTPLHVAVKISDRELRNDTIDVLLKHGASASVPNNAGQTPFDYAVSSKDKSLVERLMSSCNASDFSDDEEDPDDDLTTKMKLLQMADHDEIKSVLESFLHVNEAEEVSSLSERAEPYLALDGDVETSKKVAKLLGCTFLIPLLMNSQEQSQVLRNYLQRKEGLPGAVEQLNKCYALAKKSSNE